MKFHSLPTKCFSFDKPCAVWTVFYGLGCLFARRENFLANSDLNNRSQALIPQLCCWRVHEDTEREHSRSKGQGWIQQMSWDREAHPCSSKQASGLGDGDSVCTSPHFEDNFRAIPGTKPKYSAMLLILCFELGSGLCQLTSFDLNSKRNTMRFYFVSSSGNSETLEKKPPVIRSPNKYFKKIRICKERGISK